MTVHTLKCWPQFFERLLSGEKTFELRQTADRTFQVGDVLRQCEWRESAQAFTGRELSQDVLFVMPGGAFGISKGWCCMAVSPPREIVGDPDTTPRAWEAFARGKCRRCDEFKRVDRANVCVTCATGGAVSELEAQANG